MAKINSNYLKLAAGYLFPEIARRVNAFTSENPDAAAKLIRCGIGDVTEPLPESVRAAMHAAIDEMGTPEGFHGYGPEQGYGFLREAIAKNIYNDRGITIADDEIFVSDGSKCDSANILDIFGEGNTIAVTDPVYPVYVDTNVMVGNTGDAGKNGGYEGLVYLECNAGNGFVPAIPNFPVDLIYLCYPNNPTGTVATRDELTAWVSYAKKHGSVILYDAAYSAFIQGENIPKSIYEIDGARECAIEFRSFSKDGGFTGTRCAYTVVPKDLTGKTDEGEDQSLHALWARRQSTKFNGVSYVVQRGAEALFSDQGKAEVAKLISGYMENAKLLTDACAALGLEVFGGRDAPYVWVRCPDEVSSWEMFDKMLNEAQVVITPGSGFGAAGEGYFRISAFNSREKVEDVCKRIGALA